MLGVPYFGNSGRNDYLERPPVILAYAHLILLEELWVPVSYTSFCQSVFSSDLRIAMPMVIPTLSN